MSERRGEGAERERHVVLIHGVGNTRTGELRAAFERPLHASGRNQHTVVEEFVWNELVEQPLARAGTTISSFYTKDLARAWMVTALRDLGAAEGTGRRSLLQALAVAQQVLSMSAPLLLALAPVAWFAGRTPELARLALGHVTALLAVASFTVAYAAAREGSTLSAGVRCVVLSTLWPVMFAFQSFFNLMRIALPVLGVVALVTAGVNYASRDELLGVPLLVAFATPVMYVTTGSILRRLVAPVLKICADVARYMGDVRYRQKLMTHMDAVIQRVPRTRELYIVSHSLGSLVALDYCRHHVDRLSGRPAVVLVTAGSPLRRLIRRFFSRYMPDLDAVARDLFHAVPAFRWVNVYRPLDPVGGRLSARPSPLADISTRQWHRGHVDYFGDPVVLEAGLAAMAAASALTAGTELADTRALAAGREQPTWDATAPADTAARVIYRAGRLMPVGLLLLTTWAFSAERAASLRAAMSAPERLEYVCYRDQMNYVSGRPQFSQWLELQPHGGGEAVRISTWLVDISRVRGTLSENARREYERTLERSRMLSTPLPPTPGFPALRPIYIPPPLQPNVLHPCAGIPVQYPSHALEQAIIPGHLEGPFFLWSYAWGLGLLLGTIAGAAWFFLFREVYDDWAGAYAGHGST